MGEDQGGPRTEASFLVPVAYQPPPKGLSLKSSLVQITRDLAEPSKTCQASGRAAWDRNQGFKQILKVELEMLPANANSESFGSHQGLVSAFNFSLLSQQCFVK
jgi:hypothetical protein